MHYKLWVALAYTLLMVVLIPFYFAWVNKRDQRHNRLCDAVSTPEIADPPCPQFYALFPWMPALLLFTVIKHTYPLLLVGMGINIGVGTALGVFG
ncbi:hypothetical protein [Helicobacter felis]|uniref:hypothetical protein n=1 Tax=Helicobacter felis TaxID=214 RepID=UPI0018F849F3|nr:hypothetical protein [Helicobacter felis]